MLMKNAEIYALLKSDHRSIKMLLKQLDETSEKAMKKRESLLKQLKLVLVPHARAEELVLYNRLKMSKVREADVLAFEGYEEHAIVDRLMEQLEVTVPNDKRWAALIAVAKESLEHHIQEEEAHLFAKARKSFDRKTAFEMSEEFLELKAQFLKEVKSGETPEQKVSQELVAA